VNREFLLDFFPILILRSQRDRTPESALDKAQAMKSKDLACARVKGLLATHSIHGLCLFSGIYYGQGVKPERMAGEVVAKYRYGIEM
jgi:hypothetical protein